MAATLVDLPEDHPARLVPASWPCGDGGKTSFRVEGLVWAHAAPSLRAFVERSFAPLLVPEAPRRVR